MVMYSLLLQKPHWSAKTKDFIACHLDLWKQSELLQEGQVIQQRLAVGRAHTLIISMVIHMHGDVKAAIALSDSDDCSGAHMGLDAPLHGFQESIMDSL